MSTRTAATGLWQKGSGLSASKIKWFAIVCMLVDHIAWAFVPTFSVLGFVLHAFGRMTAPGMCFFLVEGYVYTHNIKKYLLRLGIFALLSWPCFSYFETGSVLTHNMGMIWSLFFTLLAVYTCDRVQDSALKMLCILGCAAATQLGDWPIFCIVFALVFWYFRGNFRYRAIGFTVGGVLAALMCAWHTPDNFLFTFLMQVCVLLALIPLHFYNGQRGGKAHPALNKWFFYIFYPTHLLLLGLLQHLILGH